MKNKLIIMIILLSNITYGQNNVDIAIRDAMLGTWLHDSTVYMLNDSTDIYYREKTFYNDSTLLSTGVINGDTLTSLAAWYVKDGIIRIYSIFEIEGEIKYQLVDYVIATFFKSKAILKRDWGLEKEKTESFYIKI